MTSQVRERVAVRPLCIDVPEEDLVELRRRIAETRRPEKETVADQSQGVPLAIIQKLARYFAAWEEPELFTTELRSAFRSLRDQRRSS